MSRKKQENKTGRRRESEEAQASKQTSKRKGERKKMKCRESYLARLNQGKSGSEAGEVAQRSGEKGTRQGRERASERERPASVRVQQPAHIK